MARRPQKPKRQLTPAQLEGLSRSREARAAGLARAREARAAQRAAGTSIAPEVPAEPPAAAQPQQEPAPESAPGPQVEPGVSPIQAAPPPPVMPPEVAQRVDAARAALGSTVPGAAPGEVHPPQGGVAPVIVDPRLCVGLVELANDVTIRCMATSNKVAMTPEVEKLTKLDPSVKGQLESLAPFAVPYLQELLNKGPVVGALIFGGVAIFAIANNCSKLKKHIKKAPKEGAEKTETKGGMTAPSAPEQAEAPSTSAAIWGADGWRMATAQ